MADSARIRSREAAMLDDGRHARAGDAAPWRMRLAIDHFMTMWRVLDAAQETCIDNDSGSMQLSMQRRYGRLQALPAQPVCGNAMVDYGAVRHGHQISRAVAALSWMKN
jgi:hypothetical protein